MDGLCKRYGCIVYERADTTLAEMWHHQRHDLSAIQKQAIVHQLLQALDYLRTQGIVHGDLKPQNIVKIYSNDVWKLIDFATACKEGNHTSIAIDYTLRYAAPEVRNAYTSELTLLYTCHEPHQLGETQM